MLFYLSEEFHSRDKAARILKKKPLQFCAHVTNIFLNITRDATVWKFTCSQGPRIYNKQLEIFPVKLSHFRKLILCKATLHFSYAVWWMIVSYYTGLIKQNLAANPSVSAPQSLADTV